MEELIRRLKSFGKDVIFDKDALPSLERMLSTLVLDGCKIMEISWDEENNLVRFAVKCERRK